MSPASLPQSREPSPNRGFGVSDVQDEPGVEQIKPDEWRKMNNIDYSKQVKLVKISHMRYQHPDLQEITIFLRDFGMTLIKKTETERWFRGYGQDQYVYYARKGPRQFLGGTWEVESIEELEKVTKLPGVKCVSNGVEEMEGAPGGGYIATVLDAEGFPVNFICGQSPVAPRDLPRKMVWNDESEKPRVREFQRFSPGPSPIHKLGHYGLVVRDFQAQYEFYTRNFNIVPTNLLYAPIAKGSTEKRNFVAMFAHVDRGEELVDHHSLFLTPLPPDAPSPHVHHSSYEIHDYDSQALGHEWLAKKGYSPVWGVGRHILGSQIFDYWWDPNRFMVEHYIDGDVVNNKTPVGIAPAGQAALSAWGPEVPQTFLS